MGDVTVRQVLKLWLDILGKTFLELLIPRGPKRILNPNDLPSNDAGGLKRILKPVKVIVQGAAFGLGLNYYWHYFLAISLGWGDSAPDWYFRLQEVVFLGILLIGLVGWAALYPRLDSLLRKKRSENRSP